MIKSIVKLILKYPLRVINYFYTKKYYMGGLKSLGWEEEKLGDESILIIAPHVDDETIGLGGSLIKYRNISKEKTLVYVADGSGSVTNLTKEELVEKRKEEARLIQTEYGIDNLYFLDQPDGKVDSTDDGVVESLYEIIKDKNPERIFMPFLLDGHKDHVESSRLGLKAIEKWDKDFDDIWMSEVNTLNDLRIINRLVTLDEVTYKEKKRMYRHFESQGVMGFDAFLLADRKKKHLVEKGVAAEVFVKVDLDTGFQIDRVLREKGFKPEDLRQLSSQHNMMLSFLKNRRLKKEYNNNINYILKAKYLGVEGEIR